MNSGEISRLLKRYKFKLSFAACILPALWTVNELIGVMFASIGGSAIDTVRVALYFAAILALVFAAIYFQYRDAKNR